MGALIISFKGENIKDSISDLPRPSKTAEQGKNTENNSLFVPYWTLKKDIVNVEKYDKLLYFGITASEDGIDMTESGYGNLSNFFRLAGEDIETLLVLRMLDSTVNFAILKDVQRQEKIINQTIDVAEKYGFDGIVLDLELSALPFDSLIKQINNFNSKFFRTSKSEGLNYSLTMYGDVYYRIRPFDIKNLAENSDQIMIMAYDFSKANGNPGPNFPLKGKEKYGYDYRDLIDKLLTETEAERIDVIFGLYGYDWQVDDKNISVSSGKPMSYLEIKNSILNNCDSLPCVLRRDGLSKENVISYTDTDGNKHTVWYEDIESVTEKKKYLKSKGIYNFSFWAYSYF